MTGDISTTIVYCDNRYRAIAIATSMGYGKSVSMFRHR